MKRKCSIQTFYFNFFIIFLNHLDKASSDCCDSIAISSTYDLLDFTCSVPCNYTQQHICYKTNRTKNIFYFYFQTIVNC